MAGQAGQLQAEERRGTWALMGLFGSLWDCPFFAEMISSGSVTPVLLT